MQGTVLVVGKRTVLARKAGKEVSVGAGVRGVEGAERSIYAFMSLSVQAEKVGRYTASRLEGLASIPKECLSANVFNQPQRLL